MNMITFAIYLLKVSACLTVWYALYYFAFRATTFFQLNRAYLLVTLLASFLLPAFELPMPVHYAHVVAPLQQVTRTISFKTFSAANAQSASGAEIALTLIYFSGAAFVLLRALFSVFALLRQHHRAERFWLNGVRVVRTPAHEAFSFFRSVFLPPGAVDPLVLRHEQQHIRQYHWMDLLITELALMVLWFNPVMIFFRRSVRIQHEFLADRGTLSEGVTFEQYSGCLLQHLENNALRIASSFNSSSIKTRILMMTKKRTSNAWLPLYLLLLPAGVVMLMSFTIPGNSMQKFLKPAVLLPAIEHRPTIPPVDLEKVQGIVMYGGIPNFITNEIRNHTGIDFQMENGSDVIAPAEGVVAELRIDAERGTYLVIRHGNMYSTTYSHLDNAVVKVDDKVTRGQVIGHVGSTGRSQKPHLHYEVIKNGVLVDPRDYLPKLPDGC